MTKKGADNNSHVQNTLRTRSNNRTLSRDLVFGSPCTSPRSEDEFKEDDEDFIKQDYALTTSDDIDDLAVDRSLSMFENDLRTGLIVQGIPIENSLVTPYSDLERTEDTSVNRTENMRPMYGTQAFVMSQAAVFEARCLNASNFDRDNCDSDDSDNNPPDLIVSARSIVPARSHDEPVDPNDNLAPPSPILRNRRQTSSPNVTMSICL